MAKGQISEEDLEAGLKSAGGFGGLKSSAGRARRDSPYGADFAKPEREVRSTEGQGASSVTPAISTSGNAAPANIEPEVNKSTQTKIEVLPTPPKKEEVIKPTPEPAPKISKPAASVKQKVKKAKSSVEEESESGLTKAELYSERITLNIAADTRDEAERVARNFQRKKSDKRERITANTIYRVAIQAVIEELDLLDDEFTPNTEEELLALIKERVG